MKVREVAKIFNVSPRAIYDFINSREFKPISPCGDYDIELASEYFRHIQDKMILDSDDPKIAKIIADTEKAKAETDLKRLDYEIKQKEYIKASIVENVLSDAYKALTKKVYELDKEVHKHSSLQEACEVLLNDLKLELLEKYKELDSNCELDIV
ncbi:MULTISPECIES: hypothetical protein [unclassified Campylobacter]|uniref:hypothetical protein n=1 Tax=unclassified Campylobacter TaxID=2593542 RepID=UPI001DBD3086|nr:helix-turn-helix domain-containing protein [Campylobacter sp. RM9331]MBZ8005202.1 helix-turn-helix domain-containing protein [Campylobacter sp. RM9332]